MSTPVSKEYLRNAVLQAGPEQLQLMLFDGAIRFALKGREGIEKKDFEQVYESLCRAQQIVLEMEAGLRPEVNQELCEQMSALYGFVYRKLVSASVHRNISDIDDALKILKHQRGTWALLVEKVTAAQADGGDDGGVQAVPSGSISFEG